MRDPNGYRPIYTMDDEPAPDAKKGFKISRDTEFLSPSEIKTTTKYSFLNDKDGKAAADDFNKAEEDWENKKKYIGAGLDATILISSIFIPPAVGVSISAGVIVANVATIGKSSKLTVHAGDTIIFTDTIYDDGITGTKVTRDVRIYNSYGNLVYP